MSASREELQALRRELGMTQEEFGEWLAREINVSQAPNRKQVSPYTRQRISAFESGGLVLPDKVENLILRRKLAKQEKEIEALKQKSRQRQKPKQ